MSICSPSSGKSRGYSHMRVSPSKKYRPSRYQRTSSFGRRRTPSLKNARISSCPSFESPLVPILMKRECGMCHENGVRRAFLANADAPFQIAQRPFSVHERWKPIDQQRQHANRVVACVRARKPLVRCGKLPRGARVCRVGAVTREPPKIVFALQQLRLSAILVVLRLEVRVELRDFHGEALSIRRRAGCGPMRPGSNAYAPRQVAGRISSKRRARVMPAYEGQLLDGTRLSLRPRQLFVQRSERPTRRGEPVIARKFCGPIAERIRDDARIVRDVARLHAHVVQVVFQRENFVAYDERAQMRSTEIFVRGRKVGNENGTARYDGCRQQNGSKQQVRHIGTR